MAGPKWCMNYDSGDYEWIDENGYSWDQGESAFLERRLLYIVI